MRLLTACRWATLPLRSPTRRPSQRGYECLRIERENNAVQILTPEIVIPNAIDIDESGGNVPWAIQMFSGKPTSTTLYDLLCAFFEKYDDWNDAHKHFVTNHDMTITITGLSDQECTRLPLYSISCGRKTPSMAPRQTPRHFTHRVLSFQVPKP